jgi:hypothetical protein
MNMYKANNAHNRDAPIAIDERSQVKIFRGMFCELFNICREIMARINTGIHPIKKINPTRVDIRTPSL